MCTHKKMKQTSLNFLLDKFTHKNTVSYVTCDAIGSKSLGMCVFY